MPSGARRTRQNRRRRMQLMQQLIDANAYLSLMHAINDASTSSSLAAYPYRISTSKYGPRCQNGSADDVLQLVDSDSDSDTDIISLCCGSGGCFGCCGCGDDEEATKSTHNGAGAAGFSPKVFFCSKPGRLLIAVMLVVVFFLLYSGLSGSLGASANSNRGAEKEKFNYTRASEILDKLCDSYSSGQVTGSACERICVHRNYTIKNLYEGSKTVLTLRDQDKDFILKSAKADLHDFDDIDARVDEEHFTDKIVEAVNDQLMLGFPISYKNHLLQLLWPIERGNSSVGRRQKRPPLTDAERRSLWALVQQEEYLNFRILPLSRVVPKILGTCGHFYQPEHLVAFHMKGYYMNLKAKILVHLMGTLKLFYEFLNEPLQWCDVKFDNLGLSSEYPKRFMIMDSDMLYTESKLKKLLTSRRCKSDDDCMFFDCHSQCNNTTGFCSERTNDNIDVFCTKLVTQLFGKFWTKSNRYLAACHDASHNSTQRLADLRLVWSWNLSDV